jgi:AraC family transcriptional regulator of adaptative response/methylated-DNA-[protein]-cysteine methyltransferase
VVEDRDTARRKIRVATGPDLCYSRAMDENTLIQQSEDYQRVEQAIGFLEEHFREQPSLDQIAASVHLSKYHFQRLFKRWAGVSPTQFMHYLTVEYAKERLQEAKSALETALDAGLSGPGRLHDLFVTWEAMTPGEYKRRGDGLRIHYGFHPTPFGCCLLATTERGICTLYFVSESGEKSALEGLQAEWPAAELFHDPDATGPLVAHLFGSNGGPRPFHLLLRGTNFQVKVWRALLSVPEGVMVSYQDVAELIGRPEATRAVASAIARNPISYLIPCHRVISSAGRSHRYRWGAARKKAILGWEASRKELNETLARRRDRAPE